MGYIVVKTSPSFKITKLYHVQQIATKYIFSVKKQCFFMQCMHLMLKDLSPELGNYCFKT